MDPAKGTVSIELLSATASRDALLSTLDAEELAALMPQIRLVTPGDVLSTDASNHLKGHGTASSVDGKIIATVAGVVERVDKLISVRPLKSRYVPSVGDVVVGRVVDVGAKRWRVDVQGRQHAVLLLSAVHLPGGAQRRKTDEDVLQMRAILAENDPMVAEVQTVHHDGGFLLQIRNARFGRLRVGLMLAVRPGLVRRAKQHLATLEHLGVDVALGMNGFIWVQPTPSERTRPVPQAEGSFSPPQDVAKLTQAQREKVVRVANAIRALDALYLPISLGSISATVDTSLQQGIALADMQRSEVRLQMCAETLTSITSRGGRRRAADDDTAGNVASEGLPMEDADA